MHATPLRIASTAIVATLLILVGIPDRAVALQAPLPPLSVPSSSLGVAGQVANVTDAQWNSWITQQTSKGNLVKGGVRSTLQSLSTQSLSKVGVGGSAAVAVGGFLAAYDGTTAIIQATTDLPTCPIWSFVTQGTACSDVGAALDYVLNSDVGLATLAGWSGPLNATTVFGGVGALSWVEPEASDVALSSVDITGTQLSYSGHSTSVDGWPVGSPAASGGYRAAGTSVTLDVVCSSGGRTLAGPLGNGLDWQAGSSGGALSQSIIAGKVGNPTTATCGTAGATITKVVFTVSSYVAPRSGNAASAGALVQEYTATWLPSWDPERPEGVSANPARTWRVDSLCEDAGIPSVRSERSASFTETDPEWPGLPAAGCDGSAVLTGAQWWQETAGMADTLIFEWTSPAPEIQTIEEGLNADCAGSTSCQLVLERIVTEDGKKVSCFEATELCTDWWTETQQGTNADQYRCTWGGAEIDLKECAVYKRLFSDSVYSNPNAVDPDTSIGAQPQTPAQQNGCPPEFSWTALFNPWFYYKGVQCALIETFVPTQTIQQRITATATTVQTKAPFGWFTAMIGGEFAAAGCPNWRISIGNSLSENVVCDSSFTQALRSNRLLIAGLMGAAAFAPLIRSLFYASIPVLQVRPAST